MSQPRALVTGRHGFTGRYVTQELERLGYQVVGLGDRLGAADGHSVQVDLLDREAVMAAVAEIQPAAVIHLAAIAFVAHGDVDEIYRVNVVGTRNLLDALSRSASRPEVVMLASSANIYGNTAVAPLTESVSPAPANDYAVSKLAMEYMAGLWADRLPLVITRPFNYTGVGQSSDFLIPKIVSHFQRGDKTIELGNTDVIRDFGDVRDVARIYGRIVQAKPAGQVFNICTGIGHSLNDILDMMADIAGYRIEVRVNPAFVRANEVRSLVGSNERLRNGPGVGTMTDLRQTLSWMYSSH